MPALWSAYKFQSAAGSRPRTGRLIPAAKLQVAAMTLMTPLSYASAIRSRSSVVKPACTRQNTEKKKAEEHAHLPRVSHGSAGRISSWTHDGRQPQEVLFPQAQGQVQTGDSANQPIN